MMALASAPTYKEVVVAAQEGVEILIKEGGVSNFKIYWKPVILDEQYHIEIYYDWEI